MKLKMIAAAVLATAAFGANAGVVNAAWNVMAAPAATTAPASVSAIAGNLLAKPTSTADFNAGLQTFANLTVVNGQIVKVQPQPIPAAMKAQLGGLVAQ